MIIIGVHITKHHSPENFPPIGLWWYGTRNAAGKSSRGELPAAPDRSCDPKAVVLASGPIMELVPAIPPGGRMIRSCERCQHVRRAWTR